MQGSNYINYSFQDVCSHWFYSKWVKSQKTFNGNELNNNSKISIIIIKNIYKIKALHVNKSYLNDYNDIIPSAKVLYAPKYSF